MKQRPLTVEFRLPPTGTSPSPKPPPGAKAEQQRHDRACRRARNLALAYWIDSLIRSGEVESLAAVARMCGVSRARVSLILNRLGAPRSLQLWVMPGDNLSEATDDCAATNRAHFRP